MTRKQIIKREIFYFLSGLSGIFILMEIIWPNIILAYFNLNWLLVWWFISGLVLLFKNN